MEKAIKRYWPVFVLPTLIAFIIGFVWPFIWGTGLSFCKFTTVKNVQFVGLSNYKMIFMDDTFTHLSGSASYRSCSQATAASSPS